MYPYQIQQRLLAYIEDSDMLPLIRRVINEAIGAICLSNEPNRDYSFLKTSAVVTGFSTSNRTQNLPSDCRSVIDLEDTTKPATYFQVTGDRKLYYSGSGTGQSVTVYYYKTHPIVALNSYWYGTATGTTTSIVLSVGASATNDAYNDYYLKIGTEYRRITDYDGATRTATIASAFTTDPSSSVCYVCPYNGLYAYDATWTASDPPESDILIPPELHELIVWWALDLLYEHEIEVTGNRQLIQQRIISTVSEMRSTYSVQIYPNMMPAAPTAEWLVVHGCLRVKAERTRQQMLNTVNTIASDISDALKLTYTQRPDPIVAYSTALPYFPKGGTKYAPQDLWYKAMMYYACLYITPPDQEKQALLQLDATAYQKALADFRESFYAIAVTDIKTGANTTLDTYGDMVTYLRSNLKSYRSEAQLWLMVNKGIGDIMRRTDMTRLISTYTFNTVSGTQEYTIPTYVKKIITLTLDGTAMVGRAAADFREYLSAPESVGRSFEYSTNSFTFFQGKVKFYEAPTSVLAVVITYHPRHVFVADAATLLPVDPLLLVAYLDAGIALANGKMNEYQAKMMEYQAALQDHDDQDDNYAQQPYMNNAGMSTTQLLSNMQGGY